MCPTVRRMVNGEGLIPVVNAKPERSLGGHDQPERGLASARVRLGSRHARHVRHARHG
jgi:hypothetical protein